jgi:biopolymer transport protein ExbD
MMVSHLELRVRNRRLGNNHSALLSSVNSSAFSQSALGCALVLLLVAMMNDPPHHGTLVNRYLSHYATPMSAVLRDDAVKVTLCRDGTIYFGGTRVSSEGLAEQIRKRLQIGAQHKVFLTVDQRARFADLAIVLDEVRHAGVRDIAFLAEFPVKHR